MCNPEHIEITMNILEQEIITKPNNLHVCRIEPYKGEKDFIFISYCHKDSKSVLPVIESMINRFIKAM